MKTKYILTSVALSAIMFVGCTDMDTFPEGDIVTGDQKKEVVNVDPSKAEAGVNGVYAQFSAYMPITGGRHNDFGYPSLMLFMDSNGADFLGLDNGYNWVSNSMEFEDRNFASNEAHIVWGTLYKMIYAANNVIAGIDPETTNPTIKFYLGQALTARAFDYWVLAQLYQFTYVDHKSAPCIPLVTDKNMNDVAVNGLKRSTVEETYTLILSDINKAVDLLVSAEEAGLKRRDKRYIDLGVAYGIRARINLTMQKWADAAADATKAIDKSGATPYSIDEVSVPTMYDSNDASWMWGVVVAPTDRVVTSGIVNWPSHMGSLNWGYALYGKGHQINKKLFNTISDTDARKGWWLNASKQSANLNPDFLAYAQKYPAYTQVKFAPYKNELATTTNANDIPLMRVEEMYLIKAEGEAMSGKLPQAKTTLEGFVKTYRDPSYSCVAANATDMQEEVYRQRRIELWGEGLSWFDVMRLKKGVDRRGCGYQDASMIFNIPATDNILLWRIPQDEMEANKALSPEDNNPVASSPTPVSDVN